MRGSNACYICSKSGHIVKHCTNRRSQEQGRREYTIMVQVKRFQGGNDSSHSSLGVQGKSPLVKSRVCNLN